MAKSKLTPLEAARKAVKMLGGQRPAARATGHSQHQIWKVVHNKLVNKRIDANLAAALHRATKGAVDKAELRPDLFERSA